MRYRPDQSQSTHDFDLEYPDGRVVPLEVTESTYQQIEHTIAKIRKRRYFVAAKHCQKGWIVHPTANADIESICAHVDSYLAAIEASGREKFSAYADATELPAVNKILQDLRIEAGTVVEWKTPGRICIVPPGHSASLNAEHVQRSIELEANKDDNRRKLGIATQSEHHLFVLIRHRNYAAWLAINDADPPCTIPALPKEITHVWAAARTRTQDEFVVWRASSTEIWSSVGHILLPDTALPERRNP